MCDGRPFVHAVDPCRSRASVGHEHVKCPDQQGFPREQIIQVGKPMCFLLSRFLCKPSLHFRNLHLTLFRQRIHRSLLIYLKAFKPAVLRHVPTFRAARTTTTAPPVRRYLGFVPAESCHRAGQPTHLPVLCVSSLTYGGRCPLSASNLLPVGPTVSVCLLLPGIPCP
jgi:hypothetical protein